MQAKPMGWPEGGTVELLPEVFLELTGASWPPASTGTPAGVATAGAWSTSRQLVGSMLPGQVRGASGHSIGSGSVDFAQPEGAPLSPWGRGAMGLNAGGACKLYAAHGGAVSPTRIPLGDFIVAPVKGANTSNTVSLSLDENSSNLSRPFAMSWKFDADADPFDASWVLEQIAQKSGYLRTDIEPSGSLLQGLFGISGESAWSVAQEIAKATLGAVWITEDGVFTYRNRNSMRGDGGYVEVIEALDSMESLEWTLDPGDVADRVEVSYLPVERVRSIDASTLWEATDPIRIGAGERLNINAEFTGTTDRYSGFLPIWDESIAVNRMSRWAAAKSMDGGGSRPADGALQVQVVSLAPSLAQIQIRNVSADNLWLVDGAGNPTLILRTGLHVSPGEPVAISAGASEASATNPLSLDCGKWVQEPAEAQRILSWARTQTSRALATIDRVRVAPDLSRQLGDVVLLTDAHSALRAKAIITGVELAGDANSYTQHLDLALLDVVFGDFDRWLESSGIATFSAFDSWLDVNGIVTFADFDNWLIDFGGTL